MQIPETVTRTEFTEAMQPLLKLLGLERLDDMYSEPDLMIVKSDQNGSMDITFSVPTGERGKSGRIQDVLEVAGDPTTAIKRDCVVKVRGS